jgi:hypothetical protein
VTVAGTPSLTDADYSYNRLSLPPRVFNVGPLVGPTAGGTQVVIRGEAFGEAATVVFVERDAGGAATGARSECAWRGVAGMSCNDTLIVCAAPALVTAGRQFDVSVTAAGATTVYTAGSPAAPSRWAYEAPVVLALSPRELLPAPAPGTTFSVLGRSFGALPGVVVAGRRVLSCPLWSHDTVVCEQPPGVAAAVNVTVTAASGLASLPGGAVSQLSYAAPVVTAVEPTEAVSDTPGGGLLEVTGVSFAHPLPTTVWLVRPSVGSDALPWGPGRPAASSEARECPVIPGSFNGTSIACVVPPGAGTGWRLVVVNQDEALGAGAAAGGAPWRASAVVPGFSLTYAAPVLAAVAIVDGGAGAAPAVGGFLLRVTGANFGPQAPTVMVGSLPCTVVPGTSDHGSVVCSAPPRQVDAGSAVQVVVDGQASGALPFAFDPPAVADVFPVPLLALAPAGRPRLHLRGVNFGARYRAGLPTPHVVTVGPLPCMSVLWISDGELSCVPEGEAVVGPLNVTVAVAGGDASLPVTVTAGCPRGWHSPPGGRCTPCPAGAQCEGGAADPVSLPGFFPLSRTVFVQCVPRVGCTGGVAGADLAARGSTDRAGCSALYVGDRCAECIVGAYRLKGKCVRCPDTAWLLFLGFAVAVTAAVAAAVYLAGKRINLAGLSIGVVRGGASPLEPCAVRCEGRGAGATALRNVGAGGGGERGRGAGRMQYAGARLP